MRFLRPQSTVESEQRSEQYRVSWPFRAIGYGGRRSRAQGSGATEPYDDGGHLLILTTTDGHQREGRRIHRRIERTIDILIQH